MNSPRVVRNFFIKGQVDGVQKHIGTGPKGKEGGMTVSIYMRSDGMVMPALEIEGYAYDDGRLSLTVKNGVGKIIHEVRAER